METITAQTATTLDSLPFPYYRHITCSILRCPPGSLLYPVGYFFKREECEMPNNNGLKFFELDVHLSLLCLATGYLQATLKCSFTNPKCDARRTEGMHNPGCPKAVQLSSITDCPWMLEIVRLIAPVRRFHVHSAITFFHFLKCSTNIAQSSSLAQSINQSISIRISFSSPPVLIHMILWPP